MAKSCFVCGKKPVSGNRVARRGLSKKKGGVGENVTGVTKRRFLPNLRSVRALIHGGTKTILICTRCLKADKITKAV